MLEALEWNLLGNREGWGKTNSYEWTKTKFKSAISLRLVVGDSDNGGTAYANWKPTSARYRSIGFRIVAVFGH